MNTYVVNRKDLLYNIETIKNHAGEAVFYGVIKGNGYGLGLLPMAEALRESGVDHFAVTEVHEVAALREAGYQQEEILMIRATALPQELESLHRLNAVISISDMACAKAAQEVAERLGSPFSCHLKIDTGMGRYGFYPGCEDEMAEAYGMRMLHFTGIYTHFHSAFCNEAETWNQFQQFLRVCDNLTARGISLGIRHCCNSCAFVQYKDMHLDGVRIGSALLGRILVQNDLNLRRIGWCESQIETIRPLPKGHFVGYGAAWRARRDSRIGVCGVGYLHGFHVESGEDIFTFKACFRNALHYLKAWLKKEAVYIQVNGKPAKVVGHIGMVQTMFDVTELDCQIGDPIRLEINPLMLSYTPVEFRE